VNDLMDLRRPGRFDALLSGAVVMLIVLVAVIGWEPPGRWIMLRRPVVTESLINGGVRVR